MPSTTATSMTASSHCPNLTSRHVLLDSDDDRTTRAAGGPRKPVQQRDRWSVRIAKVLVNIYAAGRCKSHPILSGTNRILHTALNRPRLHATRRIVRRRHPRTAPRPPVSALEDATPRAEQFGQVDADLASRVASQGRESRHSSATSACRSVRRSVNPSATEEIAGQRASSLRPATAATIGQLNPSPRPIDGHHSGLRRLDKPNCLIETQALALDQTPRLGGRSIAALIVTFHESRHAGHPLIKPVVPAVRGLIVTYLKARREVTR